MTVQVSYKKLSSGVTLSTDVMPQIETVSVSVLVKTGSKNETKEFSGISHFLEHMAFKGTKTRTALDIAEEFDDIGGYFNAYTSREKTVYYAKVLKDDIHIATDILSDILINSLYSEEEIEKEKEVILQEISQTFDTPDEALFEYFQEVAFPNQSFGRSILGTPENVNSFNRQMILEYLNSSYYSSNVFIGAAGNFNSSAFESIIEEKFQGLPANGNKHNEAVFYKGGETRTKKDLEQLQINLGFKGVSIHDEDYFKQQILAVILGGGMSSRLFQEIREKRGLAYHVSAYGMSHSESGIFGIYGGVSPDKGNEYVNVMIDELKKATQNISADEVRRAKAQVRASMLMSQESTSSRAEKLVGNMSEFGRYVYPKEILEDIEKIDENNLKTFASKLFSQNDLPTLASIGKTDKLLSYEEILKILRG